MMGSHAHPFHQSGQALATVKPGAAGAFMMPKMASNCRDFSRAFSNLRLARRQR